MGLSASQAKLLSITARLADNELHSQFITNAKMRLATDSSEATAEYMRSLDATQLMYTTYDAKGNKSYQKLTPGIIMTYGDLKNQYGIVNQYGQLMVSSTDAQNFADSKNMAEFLKKYGIEFQPNPRYTAALQDIYGKDYAQFYNGQDSLTEGLSDSMVNLFTNSGIAEKQDGRWEVNTDLGDYSSQLTGYLTYVEQQAHLYANGSIDLNTYNQLTDDYYNNNYLNTISSMQGFEQPYIDLKNNASAWLNTYMSTGNNAKLDGMMGNWAQAIGDAPTYVNNTTLPDNSFALGYANSILVIQTLELAKGLFVDLTTNAEKAIAESVNATAPHFGSNSPCTIKPGTDAYTRLQALWADPASAPIVNGIRITDPAANFHYQGSNIIVNSKYYQTYAVDTMAAYSDDVINKQNLLQQSIAKIEENMSDMGDDDKALVANWVQTIKSMSNATAPISTTLQAFKSQLVSKYQGDSTELDKDILMAAYGNNGLWGGYGSVNWGNSPSEGGSCRVGGVAKAIDDASASINLDALEGIDKLLEDLYALKDTQKDQQMAEMMKWFNTCSQQIGAYATYMNACEGMKEAVLESLKNIPAEEIPNQDDPKTQWYINLWYRMGGISETTKSSTAANNYRVLDDKYMNNSAWLQYAIENGIVTVEQVMFDENGSVAYPGLENHEWKSTIYTSIIDITYQDDTLAIARAEAKYEQALREIEQKDKKYDSDLKKLETQHSSMQTEYESMKGIIDKNIERSFKAFS